MATESPFISDGSQCLAGVDLSANQFFCGKLTGARQIGLASAGGENIYGIIQNKPKQGEAPNMAILGVCKASAGAAFAAGASLQTDASGRLITKTSTNAIVAVALEAATAAGQIVSVKIIPTPG